MAAVDADVTAPALPTGGEPQPRRYLVFAVVSIALFMASVDQTIVATALGTIQGDLHAQVNWSSWTITVYALGQIVAMPLAGTISDQYGRKKVFLAAIVLFTASSLCCGLANDIYVLVALRAVQAIGGGAFMPSATGIVADQFGRDRDRAIGLFTSILPIGGVVGPVLGGVFVTYWSWRGIFLVNVPIGVILLCLTIAVVPGGAPTRRRPLDLIGIGLLAAGLLGVMLAVSYLGSASASVLRAQFVVPLVVGVASIASFIRHSARAPAPFVPLSLLVSRGFGVMNVINFVWGAAVFGCGTLVPLYAEQRYRIATLGAGSLLTARAVGMISVAALAVFALRRTGYRSPMIVGFTVASIGLVLMAVRAPGNSPYLWLAISAAVVGIGIGISVPASNNATLQQAPQSTAAVTGLRGMFRQSGGITAISIITALMARSSNPGLVQAHALFVLAVVVMCLVPLVFRVPDHRGSW